MNGPALSVKPTRTIRFDEARIIALLDRLDEADRSGARTGKADQYAYRARSAALVCIQQPGGSHPATFHCPTRYISKIGIGCLHGGFVHPQSHCVVQLFTSHGTWQELSGVVEVCEHVDANVHELRIRFDIEIDPGVYCPTAVRHHVLVVEGNASLARLVLHDLAALNAEVEHVTDGCKAVETALEGSFHLILMDVEMAEMDGLQAAQELRTQGYCGRMVAFTDRQSPEDKKRAVAAGFDLHLDKPYKRKALSSLLEGLTEEPIYSEYQADPNMSELLQAFVEELPAEIRTIRLAAMQEDPGTLANAVRMMRASSGSYGFDILADAAGNVATLLGEGRSPAEIEREITDLVKLAGQVRA